MSSRSRYRSRQKANGFGTRRTQITGIIRDNCNINSTRPDCEVTSLDLLTNVHSHEFSFFATGKEIALRCSVTTRSRLIMKDDRLNTECAQSDAQNFTFSLILNLIERSSRCCHDQRPASPHSRILRSRLISERRAHDPLQLSTHQRTMMNSRNLICTIE